MSTALDLLRPEIRALEGYRPAEYTGGLVRLNANENPWKPAWDTSEPGLNRYPEPRPDGVRRRLADYYGVGPDHVLVTRGSSEAIDVLVRAYCRAGQDDIVINPPTFGMYAVYARIQGAGVRSVPLGADFSLPVADILAGWTPSSRLAFVCSPNNPTGNRFPDADIDALCTGLAGRGVVAVDAAYVDFAGDDPTGALLAAHDNVFVLRTLSKALGLAGVRCGALLGPAEAVRALEPLVPPYALPAPSRDAVLRCLAPGEAGEFARRRDLLVAERDRLAAGLAGLPAVRKVWPSEANFLLVQAREPRAFLAAARRGGLLLRDFSHEAGLAGCIRISVGDPADNDQLLRSLAETVEA